jgi:hypothetical protein
MGTFVNSGILSLNRRFKEVDLILDEAKLNFERNEQLYNALCRSAQVLLSAHFEGYLKDLIRNSLEDINQFSSFKSSSKFLKQRLCEYFISPAKDERHSKNNHQKTKELIEVFDNLDTKFKREYFIGNENQNPKATVLDKIAEQFGVKDFFKELKKSNLDLIFSNTYPENVIRCNQIREYLIENTNTYPFNVSLDYLEINNAKVDSDNLWDAFLSEMLKRRHDIAHGTEIENSVGHSIIETDKVKVEVLIYAFTTYICLKCNPEENSVVT